MTDGAKSFLQLLVSKYKETEQIYFGYEFYMNIPGDILTELVKAGYITWNPTKDVADTIILTEAGIKAADA